MPGLRAGSTAPKRSAHETGHVVRDETGITVPVLDLIMVMSGLLPEIVPGSGGSGARAWDCGYPPWFQATAIPIRLDPPFRRRCRTNPANPDSLTGNTVRGMLGLSSHEHCHADVGSNVTAVHRIGLLCIYRPPADSRSEGGSPYHLCTEKPGDVRLSAAAGHGLSWHRSCAYPHSMWTLAPRGARNQAK